MKWDESYHIEPRLYGRRIPLAFGLSYVMWKPFRSVVAQHYGRTALFAVLLKGERERESPEPVVFESPRPLLL